MPLDNLDTPLRITWDLCPSGQPLLTNDQLQQIANRLLDAGIFFLLLDARPLLHPGLGTVLNCLSDGGCQASLVLGDAAAEWRQLETLDRKINLFVDAGLWLGKPDGLAQLETLFERMTANGRRASMLWVPAAGQLHNLHSLLELCERQNIPRFKLPNRKIGANPEPVETAGLLQSSDIVQLAQMLKKRPLVKGNTALEVHDLFLWELLFPQGGGERSEYGGCQAGNSLGHITVNGDVWPCSSWPQPLGNLLQQELAAIWDSTARYRVRTEIAAEPADCAGCRDYQICFGGCRGLARTCRPDDDRRDLLCVGPRNK